MSDGVYRPILRSRRGELAALHHLDDDAAGRVMPIIELSPGDRLPQLLREMPPRTGVIAVDLGGIAELGDPLRDLAREFAGHPMIARFSSLADELGVVLPISFFERAGQTHFNSVASPRIITC